MKPDSNAVTIPALQQMKADCRKIVGVVAWDYQMAQIVDRAGVDIVSVGDTVRIGQVVGKVGSTGRSTGPHLHYETRIDGDPVDPQKFLRAGVRLGSAVN